MDQSINELKYNALSGILNKAESSNAELEYVFWATLMAGLGEGGFVPTGGTTGQFLSKASNTDFDLAWVTGSGGGGSSVWGGITGTLSDQTDLNTALSGKAPTVHAHVIADITNLQTTLDGKQVAGSYAAASHAHSITDVTGLQTALDGKQASGSYAASVHTHSQSDVTNLVTDLAGKSSTSHTHLLAAGATDVTITAANLNSLDDGLNSTLHFHNSDRDRANHTGTQTASTISDFATAVAATASVTANTAKVTNATHTGDVTGSTALTLATVNSNVGSFGLAGSVGQFVVNAKGLITSAVNVAINIASTAISDSTAAGRAMLTAATIAAQTALLDVFTSSAKGLAPASGGGTSNFLRADGTWAAPAGGGGSSDPLDLTDDTPGTPPADTVRMFRRKIAGRQIPAFIGPSGLDSSLQPFLARNKIGIWTPPGNATTVPGVFGFTAPTVTGFTATARNVATTNLFTRMRRLGFVTAATAGAVGNWRLPVYQYTTGDGAGLGGFTYILRFGISDAATVSGARMFMGMRASSTPANVEPSTVNQCIGVGHGAADTNLKLFYGGSSPQTPIDLGANFPANTLSADVYELALFSPPSATGTIHWEVTRLNTGHVATGTVSGAATVIPQSTTLLAPWGYRTNNATALAAAIDVMGAYIETDY